MVLVDECSRKRIEEVVTWTNEDRILSLRKIIVYVNRGHVPVIDGMFT